MLCHNISDIAFIAVKNVDYDYVMYNINLKQLIYYKILFLKIVGIYKKIVLILSQFFIGTVMKNPEMLKLVPDYLKTKQMGNYAIKNYLIY